MHCFLKGVSFVAAVGLVVGGFRLMLRAASCAGWNAAVPALFGVICFIAAAVVCAPHLVGIVLYPITSLIGQLFHPEDRFTVPPESLLRTLRQRISERQFASASQQIEALFRVISRVRSFIICAPCWRRPKGVR